MSARIRTGFSFRRAAGKLEDVLGRLQEIGATVAPITDTTTFGWSRWSKLAPEAGLRPVYGVEIAVQVGDSAAKRPALDPWLFLARNSVVPLNRLLATATQQFHYEPLLTISQALSVPDLFVIAGHRFDPGLAPNAPNLFVGLSPACAPGFIRRATEAGHAFVATGTNRYPTERHKTLYEVIAGKSADIQSYPQHILSDREWRATVPAELADHALGNRDAVLAQSVAALPHGALPTPEKLSSLRTICEAGAAALGIRLEGAYAERLDHELAVIESKGFGDYFFIVADICRFARQRMLVGPARGSSCGSLVCYLLNITTIDPIPFDLLFERFIDVARDDLPDIDIDFSEQHRDLVFNYVRERYGSEHVARLGTVNFYQTRSALNETVRALDIPPWITDPIITLAEEHGIKVALESEAGAKILKAYPEMIIASDLEGHPRHAGQHAAGVIITQGPVTDVVAVDHRTGATMCDKYDAEKLNLLKIDALGLLQLSIFEHALHLAKLPRQHLFQVRLDDPQAFAVLNKNHFAGVFQFNGKAVQDISKSITVETIHDIVAIIALARPGPLNSGAARMWTRHRTKSEIEKTALHDLLPETFGLIVYQEQVMRICREIGGMDWASVNALRRIIARVQSVEELAKFRELFVAGALQKMDSEQAEKLWSNIVTFGGYGFNKSHAVTYGIIGYWCCWLKAHHALEFAAAMLSYVGEDQQLTMLREMESEGVPFVAADPKLSTDKWTVGITGGKRQLLGPLTNIVGIGPTHCATIMSARALGHELTGPVAKALDRCVFKIPNTSPVANRIAEIVPDLRERNIISTPTPIKNVRVGGDEVMVIGVVDKMKPREKKNALGLWINDDDEKIWCWVPEVHAKTILERGRAGTAIYALKGTTPRDGDRAMIFVRDIKYIGDMEGNDAMDGNA